MNRLVTYVMLHYWHLCLLQSFECLQYGIQDEIGANGDAGQTGRFRSDASQV